MMKASLSPLAHLVDGVAERWIDREQLTAEQLSAARDEILRSFRIGEREELTFHGRRYQLTISRSPESADGMHIFARELPPEART
ncbi:MAG: hypothetical protein HKN56_02435 [Gammaproteobacteria bacterium]|nr:hypothetical protein [Gammaproteobacteria bacterium]NND53809.1 hypothetical protein [Gammaproteobacteria bacterium]